MKIVSFEHQGRAGVGVLHEQEQVVVRLLTPTGERVLPSGVRQLVGDTMDPGHGYETDGERLPLQDVTLHAPFAHPPRNVFCVGKNYVEHAKEFDSSGYDSGARAQDGAVPDFPIIFTKPTSCIVGPDAEIDPHREVTQALDYEAEVAIVIGKPGFAITPEDAWSHVWGMTLVNDVTARDLQQRHKQWFLGKCLDTFLPMGPWLVSMDELRETDIVLEGRVNGELRQRASMRDLIFDVPTIIATLSSGMALQVGDVIATGTPAGVGVGMSPPRFLEPGDEVEVSATQLGRLTNTVSQARTPASAGGPR